MDVLAALLKAACPSLPALNSGTYMLVILDRDGVINEDSDAYIKSLDEWRPIAGSIDAIARLSRHGFNVVVATNQSGLGRGLFTLDDLEAMHHRLCEMVESAGGHVAGIFYCPHTPDDHCDCRKPKAGLIDAIERELNTSARGAWSIGDSLRDLEAAHTKHCQPVLVLTGKGQKTQRQLRDDTSGKWSDVRVFDNLAAAADALIAETPAS
jgi:D-glycero-D-manno-heptose 1,7-bisphosphate phosphatase